MCQKRLTGSLLQFQQLGALVGVVGGALQRLGGGRANRGQDLAPAFGLQGEAIRQPALAKIAGHLGGKLYRALQCLVLLDFLDIAGCQHGQRGLPGLYLPTRGIVFVLDHVGQAHARDQVQRLAVVAGDGFVYARQQAVHLSCFAGGYIQLGEGAGREGEALGACALLPLGCKGLWTVTLFDGEFEQRS